MDLLAFDTATESITISISYGGKICETTCSTGLKHAGNLMPMIDNLLSLQRIPKENLEAIICTSGPGSFTGLRIGMATGKGLAMGLSIPLVSVPTLDVYAHPYSFTGFPVLSVMDAKKKRIYAALFRGETRLTPYLDETPENVIELAQKALEQEIGSEEKLDTSHNSPLKNSSPIKILVTGPGASLFFPHREAFPCSIDNGRLKGVGCALLSLGEKEFEKRGGDPKNAGPLYLRKSEAELDMERGLR